jgi:hypothetical protein
MKKFTLFLVLILSSFCSYSATPLDSLSDISLQRTKAKLISHELGVVSQFYKAVPNDRIWWGKGFGYNIGFKALRNMELITGFFAIHSRYEPKDYHITINQQTNDKTIRQIDYSYGYWRFEAPIIVLWKIRKTKQGDINLILGYKFNFVYVNNQVINKSINDTIVYSNISKPKELLYGIYYNNVPLGISYLFSRHLQFDLMFNLSSYDFGTNHRYSTFGDSNVSFKRMPYVQFNFMYRL